MKRIGLGRHVEMQTSPAVLEGRLCPVSKFGAPAGILSSCRAM